jgi:cysteine-rich repeat protein
MFTKFFHLKPIFVLLSVWLLIIGLGGTAGAASGSLGGSAQPLPLNPSPDIGAEFEVSLGLTNVSQSNETFPNVPPDPEVGIAVAVDTAEIIFPSGAASFVDPGGNGCVTSDSTCVLDGPGAGCVPEGNNKVVINLKPGCMLAPPLLGVPTPFFPIATIRLLQASPDPYIMEGHAVYLGLTGICEEAGDGDAGLECSNAEPRHDCSVNADCDYTANGGDASGTANITPASVPICGDGIVNVEGETCDPPGSFVCPVNDPGCDLADERECRNTSLEPPACTYCGDGIVDPDTNEECDDGNSINGDGCNNDCTAPCSVIIEKTVAPDIACDTIADDGAVFSDLTTVVQDECVVYQICVTNTGEQVLDTGGVLVDDGDLGIDDLVFGPIDPGETICKLIPGDAGAANCNGPSTDTFASCECLDVEGINTAEIQLGSAICQTTLNDACLEPGSDCNDTAEVVCIAECGDGILGPGETCDPPLDPPSPDPNDGSCRANCTFCGDGNQDAGEECDDGTLNSDTEPGACRTNCTLPICGDGVVDPGEQCDTNPEPPVNGDPGDLRDCRPGGDPAECTFCGDGIVNNDEACDDGNSNNNDACNNECQPTTCAVDIIKDSSCDGGDWGDGCTTLETGNVRVRYTYSNAGTADLFNCVITDTNQMITADPGVSVTPDGDIIAADGQCSTLEAGGEPDTATIVCECFEDGSGITTQDQDNSDYSCGTCGVEIIKESACNGGPFGDGCSTSDTGTVQVQYRYINTGTEDLVNCTVDETNFVIPDISTPFDLPAGGSEVTDVRATDQCSTLFSGGEPDIATISCECVDMDGNLLEPVTDEDQSDFECLTCEVLVDRQVSCDDGQSYVDIGLVAGNIDGTEVCSTLEDAPVCLRYTAINAGDAPLANCMLTDDNGLLGIVNEPVIVTSTESVIYEECFDMCIDVVDNEPGTAQLVCECFEQNSGESTSDFDEAGFDCTQPPIGCRITGGGITPDNPPAASYAPGVAAIDKATFGGQVGASCGCIGCFDDLDHISGHWTHNLKVEKGKFHASDYSSLVCNLDDGEGPKPRKAPANSACFAGIGYLDMKQSRGNQRVAFRVEVEDRGEPGAGKNSDKQADVYRIRVWIPEQGQEPEDLLDSICCLNADPLEVPEPDIDDGADLIHGNIQIHPVLPNTENERCPPPTPRTGECFDAAAGM